MRGTVLLNMARQINRTSNPILYWKPNQFPLSRRGRLYTDRITVQDLEDESEDDSLTDEEKEKIEYLKNRFKNEDESCPCQNNDCCNC